MRTNIFQEKYISICSDLLSRFIYNIEILYILGICMVCKVNYNTSKREGTQFMDKN